MDYKCLIWYLRRAPNTNIGMTSEQPLEWDAADAIADLLTRAEAAEEEAEQLRNEHIKIQYHGEELTIKEICERLERAEKIISDMGYNVQHINYPPQKGLTVWYIDDSGEPEKGTVFSVEIKNGILDSFSVDFEDDFDEFNGSAWGKYVFDNPDGK